MIWQPIETAPKDGTKILLGNAQTCADGYWLQEAYAGNGAWIWPYIHRNPTHWMPLVLVPYNDKAKAGAHIRALR